MEEMETKTPAAQTPQTAVPKPYQTSSTSWALRPIRMVFLAPKYLEMKNLRDVLKSWIEYWNQTKPKLQRKEPNIIAWYTFYRELLTWKYRKAKYIVKKLKSVFLGGNQCNVMNSHHHIFHKTLQPNKKLQYLMRLERMTVWQMVERTPT